jgi:hypothetical protein
VEKIKRTSRKYCKVYMDVRNHENGEHLGHMVDVTTQGLMLLSEAPIHTEAVFHLEIFLPGEVEGKTQITVSALSRWCKEDENPGFYNTGFEFRKVSPKDRHTIEQVIQKFCFKG